MRKPVSIAFSFLLATSALTACSGAHDTSDDTSNEAINITGSAAYDLTTLQEAHKRVESAGAQVDALRAQLSAEMAPFAPALTDAQQQRYMRIFNADNSGALQQREKAYQDAAKDLDGLLTKLMDPRQVTQRMHYFKTCTACGPQLPLAMEIYRSYAALAHTTSAQSAMQFASRLAHDPAFPEKVLLAKGKGQWANFDPVAAGNEMLAPAIVHTLADEITKIQMAGGSDFRPAVAAVITMLKATVSQTSIAGFKGLVAGLDMIRNKTILSVDLMKTFMSPHQLEEQFHMIGDAPHARMLVGAAALYALMTGSWASLQGNDLQAFQSLAVGAVDVASTAGAFVDVFHALKGQAAEAASLVKLSELAAKITPGIDVLVNVLSLWQDATTMKDGDAFAAVCGDALIILGAFVELGTPVGLVAIGIGTAVSLLAHVLWDRDQAAQAKAVVKARLVKVLVVSDGGSAKAWSTGDADKIAEAMVNADTATVLLLSTYPHTGTGRPLYGNTCGSDCSSVHFGIKAEALQQIGLGHPDFFHDNKGHGAPLTGLQTIVKTFDLNQNGGDGAHALLLAADGTQVSTMGFEMVTAGWLKIPGTPASRQFWLDRCSDFAKGGPDNAAFGNALKAFLAKR